MKLLEFYFRILWIFYYRTPNGENIKIHGTIIKTLYVFLLIILKVFFELNYFFFIGIGLLSIFFYFKIFNKNRIKKIIENEKKIKWYYWIILLIFEISIIFSLPYIIIQEGKLLEVIQRCHF